MTGVGQLEATDDGATTDLFIDRYGDWNLAMIYAPDGLDTDAALKIVTDGGGEFLEIDGQRSEFPTVLLSSEPGGPPAAFTVEAAEGTIGDTELFADGFESGDTSAWNAGG